jgi:hypothetical protein
MFSSSFVRFSISARPLQTGFVGVFPGKRQEGEARRPGDGIDRKYQCISEESVFLFIPALDDRCEERQGGPLEQLTDDDSQSSFPDLFPYHPAGP